MIVIIFLLILNMGTLAFLFFNLGTYKPIGPKHPKEGPAKFIIEELGFDDQQQKAFNELKKEHQGQMKMMEDSMRMQRDLLGDIIINGDVSKNDAVSTIIAGYQKKIEIYTFQHFVKVHGLCNDEQKKKFKNIIGDILKMMAPHKGGPPPH